MGNDDFFNQDEDLENDDFFLENTEDDEKLAEDSTQEEESDLDSDKDTIVISKKKLAIIKNIIARQKEDCEKLTDFLEMILPSEEASRISIGQLDKELSEESQDPGSEAKIVEGVFDGENMIGPDGKKYSMPSNYASKSKLIEGDIMKLSILNNGTFLYKQIGPAKRKRVVGILKKDHEGNYVVESEGRKWKILTASVTYFKGVEGDEVVLLVPVEGESKWGAVENIINSGNY